MSDLAGTNPLEVGFDWTLDWDKDFIGKTALLKVKEIGAKRALLGFVVDDDAAEVAVGAEAEVNGQTDGKVTMILRTNVSAVKIWNPPQSFRNG